ncbi:phage portal protein [Holzapfeliella sp. JNUCC 80]
MWNPFKKAEKRSSVNQVYRTVSVNDFQTLLSDNTHATLADNPQVRAAVDVVADLVSNMSIHLMQSTDKGALRVNNGLSKLIDISPAKNMTRKSWITKIVRDLFLYGDGNSIARIVVQPGSDYLTELQPLDMSRVIYKYSEDTNELVINYKNEDLSSDQLVHFLINPDPAVPQIGTSVRDVLQPIITNLAQAAQTKSTFMRGKYMPNLIVKVDAEDQSLKSKEARQKVVDSYTTSANGLAPWVIPAGMDVEQVKPLSLKDIALNESVELDNRTIAAAFGIPPFLLGVGNFDKQQFNNFVNTKIASIGQMIAQTLTKDILYSPDLYFQFNPRSLYSYDISELINSGKEMVDRTAMSRNELRGWVGLEPREDMEELITLENYIPSSALGDQSKLKGGDTDDNQEKN